MDTTVHAAQPAPDANGSVPGGDDGRDAARGDGAPPGPASQPATDADGSPAESVQARQRRSPRRPAGDVSPLDRGALERWHISPDGDDPAELLSPSEAAARTAVMVLKRRSMHTLADLQDGDDDASLAEPPAAEPTATPRPPLASFAINERDTVDDGAPADEVPASQQHEDGARQGSAHGKVLPGETPRETLDRVLQRGDLKLLGEYFGSRGDFYGQMLEEFLLGYDFLGMSVDYALRQLLSAFVLPVEAQQIDRVIQKFAARYQATNPNVFQHADTVYVLAFSIIMLNTDQHNPSVKTRMTKQQFMRNNRGIDQGRDIPERTLEKIFESIRHEPISYPGDAAPADAKRIPEESYSQAVLSKAGTLAASLSRKLGKRQSTGADFSSMLATGKTIVSRIGRRLSAAGTTAEQIAAAAAAAAAAATAASATAQFQAVAKTARASSMLTSAASRDLSGPIAAAHAADAEMSYASSPLKRSDSAPDVSELRDESDRGIGDEATAGVAVEETLPESVPVRSPSFMLRRASDEGREGLLCKKNDLDADGRRSTRRSWRLFHVILREGKLLLHKTDTHAWPPNSTPPGSQPLPVELTMVQEITLEHAFAFAEYGHRGRTHVFRLVTANKAAFLFQGVSLNDVNLWIAAVNREAVRYSSFGDGDTPAVSREDKIAAIRSEMDILDRKIKKEAAYRDGIAKLVDGHKSFANPAAEAEAAAQYSRWEHTLQGLSEEMRRLRCYASMLSSPAGGASRPSSLADAPARVSTDTAATNDV